ncbi:hypothetical protein [Nonomuraea sp. NPDC049400]|uniref:hypothetical protein n=1 Tax=Nonomuraea sp. NPDC049400 TaxID=3364352 RepID=UPI0037BDF235
MASIIAALLDGREISKYLIGIADVEAEWDLYKISTDASGWVGTGDNGIAIDEAQSERCMIKYEFWDGPPPPFDSWDRSWSGSVHLASGRVFSISGRSGDAFHGAEFDLGQRDNVWQVKILRKSLGYEEFTPDLISFTLLKAQFWPAPL